MAKNFICILSILCAMIYSSCSTSKNATAIKLNDIDSVIRIVNPDHNCGCNWGDKTFTPKTGGSFGQNNYFWQSVFVKSFDSINIFNQSNQIREQLVKLNPGFITYNRFFLEYRLLNPSKDTSAEYKIIGTWYKLKNSCVGFIHDIDAKELVKRTNLISNQKKLCK